MSLSAMITATALGLVSLTAPDAPAPKGLILAQATPFVSSQGAVRAPAENYMTTKEGCTYRRTKAPGYPERWILVLNPHHIGKPNSPRSCRGMM
ncbi:MAG: hypothetical protein N4A53_14345 [Pelagimonas sp.]|jgi:hypothetical protein|nr:hypothetical protein [Pelagimonas sp.]